MPAQPLKYQPYHGYYRKPWPWYWHLSGDCPRRIRTRSDWRWNRDPACQSGSVRPNVWSRRSNSDDSTYEKRRAHRAFRRQMKHAIAQELCGHEAISHRLNYYGDWLD